MAILTGMKIIYNDIIPFKGYKAINLFGIVFARKSARPLSDKNKNHEAIHTAQMKELLYVPSTSSTYWIGYFTASSTEG